MVNIFEDFFNFLNFFDLIFIVILIYNIVQCFIKGFSLSLISFMKWVLSAIITILLVPKLQPVVSEYIQSEFINNVGLGIAIFIITLFIILLIGKTLSKAVTWTGVGSLDRYLVFCLVFLKDML